MKRIVYIGTKPRKSDNLAKTGLTWERGQVHEVSDDKQAALLLEHPDIWADAESKYELRDPTRAPQEATPNITVIVPGAKIVIPSTAEVIAGIASERLRAVFMTKDEAELFELWKHEGETKALDKGLTKLPLGLPKKNGPEARA